MAIHRWEELKFSKPFSLVAVPLIIPIICLLFGFLSTLGGSPATPTIIIGILLLAMIALMIRVTWVQMAWVVEVNESDLTLDLIGPIKRWTVPLDEVSKLASGSWRAAAQIIIETPQERIYLAPHMKGGPELAKKLRELRPDLPVEGFTQNGL